MNYREPATKRKTPLDNGSYEHARRYKPSFRALLQRYCNLVICPKPKQRLNVAALNAQRLAAAWHAVVRRPSIAPDLVVIAGKRFEFSDLEAFRMQVDAMHMRGAK